MKAERDMIMQEMRNAILSACVESFGIAHQVPYIEFRNDDADDFTIQMECSINLKRVLQQPFQSESIKDFLVFMSECNLVEIINLEVFNQNDLLISFANGSELTLINKTDMNEPWSFFNSNKLSTNNISIVAIESSGFAMWKERA